ncbi:OmpA family protein [Pontibacter ruber]|uniref:OmpA family protein n=1 Tax=Pontibacter ruber TaxID=1343895 RepID=A0ABW5CXT6_9BACT|nr:OmpA family protein [Pontibacter ruber]
MKKINTIIACAALAFCVACSDMDSKTETSRNEAEEATADTAVAFENEKDSQIAADGSPVDVDQTGEADWDVDFNMPTVDWPEFKDTDVEVRGNDQYSVYSLGENVLFDTDKAEIKKDAEANLQKISSSIAQRSKEGQVRIYGYTDAKGSASYNKELAEKRAEAVKNWLQKQGKIDAYRLSVHPVGEARPAESNATAKGRQQNRRVEIVVRNS